VARLVLLINDDTNGVRFGSVRVALSLRKASPIRHSDKLLRDALSQRLHLWKIYKIATTISRIDTFLFSLSVKLTLHIMGLIRDALGSALGSNQVNNGFGGGPKLPLRPPGPRGPSYDYRMQSSGQDYPVMGAYPDRGYQSMDRPPPDQMQQRYNGYRDQYSQPRRRESSASDRRSWNQGQSYDGRSYNDLGNTRDMGYSRNGGFRPLALPQMAYGDGQPFLRGYNNELVKYGISPEQFIQVLDAINVAIIPSPENQIFQKGANIAGWFL
jgi:hypothetical protein